MPVPYMLPSLDHPDWLPPDTAADASSSSEGDVASTRWSVALDMLDDRCGCEVCIDIGACCDWGK
jgi:hypothetical protein